jgi:hypothetical protein
MRRSSLSIAIFLVACGHDVPEHDVVITSDCNGPVRSGRFHFDALDFETSCSGGILSGSCSTNVGIGKQISGDLEVDQLILEGLEEFGPSRYVLTLPRDQEPMATDLDLHPFIWCGWYVNESLEPEEGKRQDCYYSPSPCWAALDVEL